MKCQTVHDIRADINCFPGYVTQNIMGRDIIAKGTIICRDQFALADCVALVMNGLAVPLDDECRAACNLDAAQIAAKVAAMDKLLHPSDVDEDEDDEDYEDDE